MRYLLILTFICIGLFCFSGCAYPPYREEPTRVEEIERSKTIEKGEWKPTLGN